MPKRDYYSGKGWLYYLINFFMKFLKKMSSWREQTTSLSVQFHYDYLGNQPDVNYVGI